MKFSLSEVAELGNRAKIIEALEMILIDTKSLGAHHLQTLFGFPGRAAQFVIKAVIVHIAYGAETKTVQLLLSHLADYSWSEFDYSAVASKMTPREAAAIVHDLSLTMAAVLLGQDQ